ncbi:hypothetical protein VFPPC_02711 [Pochonia chlamydosporia 170]|uniref:Uncharacterized protein n=1 Tax=Pochonia chlamydosporia 170 TaxID=1380566 RepID=A0A179FXU5_METCM|nr:hypothetical protein VFPPC_02711 [Pochonia chlamydosporia 170]OAQ70207.1 hypothetical protein VFPPC_02711 [Pochonia chlamydosporia 170]
MGVMACRTNDKKRRGNVPYFSGASGAVNIISFAPSSLRKASGGHNLVSSDEVPEAGGGLVNETTRSITAESAGGNFCPSFEHCVLLLAVGGWSNRAVGCR